MPALLQEGERNRELGVGHQVTGSIDGKTVVIEGSATGFHAIYPDFGEVPYHAGDGDLPLTLDNGATVDAIVKPTLDDYLDPML